MAPFLLVMCHLTTRPSQPPLFKHNRPKAKKEKALQSALDTLYGDLAAEPDAGKGSGDLPEDKVRVG